MNNQNLNASIQKNKIIYKQLSWLEDEDKEPTKYEVSIVQCAKEIGVSEATVRNWLKLGLLLRGLQHGKVTRDSIENLKKNSLGISKLISRSNKSQKTTNESSENIQSILSSLKKGDVNEHTATLYENSLSESVRNKEGIYYTGLTIASDMLRHVSVTESTTFLDPCCGCGDFIMAAIQKGIRVENIYGFDTDAYAVEITRRRIFAKTGQKAIHIVNADFLIIAKNISKSFDLIYTNPPWGKKIAKEEKLRLGNMYDCGESVDTCSLFLFASLEVLSQNGFLGFLFPESILNISSFQSLRKKLITNRLLEIKDYGRPFKGILTKAYSIILEKTLPFEKQKIKCFTEVQYERKQSSFYINPKHILNIWVKPSEQTVIDFLFAIPHTSLFNAANWGLGIVTGDNHNKCKSQQEKGWIPVYRGKDISHEGLVSPSLFINSDLSNCQQVASLNLYYAKEKIIYRFISNKLVFYCDTEQKLILNSANMLVLKELFPLSSKQLVSLLNSRLMNWIFDKVFHTHKILRGDLETLPIYTTCFENNTFNENLFLEQNNIEYNNGTYRIKKQNM